MREIEIGILEELSSKGISTNNRIRRGVDKQHRAGLTKMSMHDVVITPP
jgi:hypothetical protein